jgi:hypothetical protein
MAIDKTTITNLQRFATAFREARERGANESDTVMFLVKFIEEVLGYDSLKGEISKELSIKDRYCDVALKVGGMVRVLVECKAASIRALVEKHIEQAENYASRAGIRWVVLTNGIGWKLFHLSFGESEGIAHESAFEVNLLEDLETGADSLWGKLSLLSRESVEADGLEQFWSQKKALSPAAVVRVLFSQDVLTVIRRELNRNAPARLDIEDVFTAIREVLSKEALLEAGDIGITKRRKRRRRRKVTHTDAETGQAVTEVVEEDVPDDEAGEPAEPAKDNPPAT